MSNNSDDAKSKIYSLDIPEILRNDPVRSRQVYHSCKCIITYIYQLTIHSMIVFDNNLLSHYPCPFCGSGSGVPTNAPGDGNWIFLKCMPFKTCYKRATEYEEQRYMALYEPQQKQK